MLEIQVKLNTDYIEVTDEEIKIGDLTISFVHEQDCCEVVYADFEQFNHYIKQVQQLKVIEKVRIKAVENEGFVLFFEKDWKTYEDFCSETKVGVFIPCYNEQNGYYSNNLELLISYKEKKYSLDLSECMEDRLL